MIGCVDCDFDYWFGNEYVFQCVYFCFCCECVIVCVVNVYYGNDVFSFCSVDFFMFVCMYLYDLIKMFFMICMLVVVYFVFGNFVLIEMYECQLVVGVFDDFESYVDEGFFGVCFEGIFFFGVVVGQC